MEPAEIRTTDVMYAAGLSYRQVDYGARTQQIRAGSGSTRLFTDKQAASIVVAALMHRLAMHLAWLRNHGGIDPEHLDFTEKELGPLAEAVHLTVDIPLILQRINEAGTAADLNRELRGRTWGGRAVRTG